MNYSILLARQLFLTIVISLNVLLSFSQVVVNVSSIAELQSAINNSATGDVIVLADGTYLNSVVSINKSNITVRAATPGGVFLNGTQEINIAGDYNTFSGFQFTSGNIGESEIINVYGDHNILTQLNFNGYFAKKYIHINGETRYNEITYCNIENKPVEAVPGCLIQITTSETIPGYHKIRYCTFKNFPGPGGDYGNEPIRIGLSTEMTNKSRTVVEYCYFNNVGLGDGESVSVKSSENICRYNTFTNNPQGQLVFRHGYLNVAYGNFFVNNSGGIRIKEGANHYVYNNYFATGTQDAIVLQYVAEFPLDNINFVHNTFVDGTIKLGSSGLTNVTFANNIFKKSSGSIFKYPIGNEKWIGNIYSGTLGIPISSGMTNADPLLELNSEGYFGISALSPAIDFAKTGYPAILDIAGSDDDPFILLDISGQPRPEADTLKDVGCDEFAEGGILNRPLISSDAGPSFLGGPFTVLQEQSITFPELLPKVSGDGDFSAGATASSNLPVAYASSNKAVATILNGNIHITGGGVTTITASQTGDSTYNIAANVSRELIVSKQSQSISFAALPPKFGGDPDFNPGAYASSGLIISYSSSDTLVATIVDGNIHIKSSGESFIGASQIGDANFHAALDVAQKLIISKQNQTIDFPALQAKSTVDQDFNPGATVSSGLPVSYISSDETVAILTEGNIHIVGEGAAVITAMQSGDASYNPATDVSQTLTVSFPTNLGNLKMKNNCFMVCPNPVTQNANVFYQIPENTVISLVIIDGSGRSVKELVTNEKHSMGSYTRSFDFSGMDDGIYVVRLLTHNYTKALRLIVSK